MVFHEVCEQRLADYIVDDIKQSSPELDAWLAGIGPHFNLDRLITQLCDRCCSGIDDERRQSLQSLTKIQTESRVHRVQLTDDTIDAIVRSLQHVTAITESDSGWNLELVGALDAFRPGNLAGTATQIRELLRKFDEPAHLAATCTALEGCGRDAASCALPELLRQLASNSDVVVQAALVTLQTLEDDAKPSLSSVIQIALSESLEPQTTDLAIKLFGKLELEESNLVLQSLDQSEIALLLEGVRFLGPSARETRKILEKILSEQESQTPGPIVAALEYDRWSDIGLGIRGDGERIEYLVFSPRPSIGDTVNLELAIPLVLPRGFRFPRLFGLFARSEYGISVHRNDLAYALGSGLTMTLADLRREFLKKITAVENSEVPPFGLQGNEVECAFVVQALLQTGSGPYRFGRRADV